MLHRLACRRLLSAGRHSKPGGVGHRAFDSEHVYCGTVSKKPMIELSTPGRRCCRPVRSMRSLSYRNQNTLILSVHPKLNRCSAEGWAYDKQYAYQSRLGRLRETVVSVGLRLT